MKRMVFQGQGIVSVVGCVQEDSLRIRRGVSGCATITLVTRSDYY